MITTTALKNQNNQEYLKIFGKFNIILSGGFMHHFERALIIAMLCFFVLAGSACGPDQPNDDDQNQPGRNLDPTVIPDPGKCIHINEGCSRADRYDEETETLFKCCGEGTTAICKPSPIKPTALTCQYTEI